MSFGARNLILKFINKIKQLFIVYMLNGDGNMLKDDREVLMSAWRAWKGDRKTIMGDWEELKQTLFGSK